MAVYKTRVVAEARRRFAPSRVRWERIEPIAGQVTEIDGKVDARVDDFEGVDDPQFTGWHRLEYHLWKLSPGPADQGFELPPAAVALGPAELVEEVSEGKITGEEDRYPHTDLSDLDANVDGSRKLFELLTPALQAKDAAPVSGITGGFAAVDRSLAPTTTPTGPSTPTPPGPPGAVPRPPPAGRRPRELVRMPFLADDRLDPAQSHGDLLLALSADQPDMLLHALRQLMRRTRDNLVLHWMLDGYNRNLLGFKDGTANLDVGDRRLMDELVWVGPDDGEPAWAVGGSYQAVRIIRMFVEFWDRTPPERAAEDHRPRQGRRGPARPGPRARRPRLRRGPGRPAGPPGTPTSAWPTRAPPRPPAAASCAAASTSRAASTPPVGSIGAWPSSATRRA